MGETKKIIDAEAIRGIYDYMLDDLHNEISGLTKDEKRSLRNYVESLSANATIHAYSSIFIRKKISGIIRERTHHA